ncbi:MAG: SH3 domain-containing protein [bacterium]|nr:SH3 domain-containing protein [bacterium]
MAKNPNEIPPWLLDDDEDEPGSSAPPPKPPAPPSPPQSSAPRPGDPAPWLSGFDEEDDEDAMLQGSSLNREWLASGDFLAANVETELTYDEWYARQQEARREKDIEEEIPELLQTDDLAAQVPAVDSPKGTGILPDWFLGMESLSPAEEPDWMTTGDQFASEQDVPVPTVKQEDVPSWMRASDEFDHPAVPKFSGFSGDPEDSDDAIQSFFASLGDQPAAPAAEDELPPEFSFGASDMGASVTDFMTGGASLDVPRPGDGLRPVDGLRQADRSDGSTGILPSDDAPFGADAASFTPADEWTSLTREIAQSASELDFRGAGDPPQTGLFDAPAAPEPEDPMRALFGEMADEVGSNAAFASVVTDPSMIPADVDDLIAAGPDESWFDDVSDQPQYSGDDDEPESKTFATGMLRELDSFFGGVASRRETIEPHDDDLLDDPDIDMFLRQPEIPVTGPLMPPPESPANPPPPAPSDENTLSWLNELTSIVSSVTRGDQPEISDSTDELYPVVRDELPPAPSFDEYGLGDAAPVETAPSFTFDRDDAPITSIFETGGDSPSWESSPSTDAASFDWDQAAPVPDAEQQSDTGIGWLNAIDTGMFEAAQTDPEPAPDEPLLPSFSAVPPPASALTGMLRRFDEPAAEPEPDFNMTFDEPTGISAEIPFDDPPERTFSALDSDFEAPPLLDIMGDDAALEVPDLFADVPAPAAQADSFDLDLSDFYADVDDAGLSVSAPDAAEAAYQAYFGDSAAQSGQPSDDTDFFSLIQADPEANLLDAQPPPSGGLISKALDADFEPPALFGAPPSPEPEDDLFTAFGSVVSESAPVTDSFEPPSLFGTPAEPEPEAPSFAASTDEDDLFAGLSFDDLPGTPSFDAPAALEPESTVPNWLRSAPVLDDQPLAAPAISNVPPADEDDDTLSSLIRGMDEYGAPDAASAPPTPEPAWQTYPSASAEELEPGDEFAAMLAGLADDSTLVPSPTDVRNAPTAPEPVWEAAAERPSGLDAEPDLFDFETPDDDSAAAPTLQPGITAPSEYSEEALFSLFDEQDADVTPSAEQDAPSAVQFDAPSFDEPAFSEVAFDDPEFGQDFVFDALEIPAAEPVLADADDSVPGSTDDFFGSLTAEPEAADTAAPAESDFFGALSFDDAPETASAPAQVDTADFFSALEFEGDAAADPVPAKSSGSDDDFFGALDFESDPAGDAALSDDAPSFETFESPAQDAEPSFESLFGESPSFAQNDAVSFDDAPSFTPAAPEPTPAAPASPVFSSLDDYLAMLSTSETPEITPEAADLLRQSDVDLDKLFSEGIGPRPSLTPQNTGDLQPTVGAEWLNEIQAQVGEVSPTALVRQRKDRPEEELPDRLKRLREREKAVEEKLSTAEAQAAGSSRRVRRRKAASQPAETDALSEILPDSGLAPAAISTDSLTLAQAVALTPEQAQKVSLLRSLVSDGLPNAAAGRGANRLSAIDLTYDTPYLRELEDNENTIVQPRTTGETIPADAQPKAVRRRKVRTRRRLDRFVVAAALLIVMVAPFFVTEMQIVDPPRTAADGGPGVTAVYRALNALTRTDYVLVAVEYSPASAGELDRMTDALLRHILLRGAHPVIVSTNPFGVLRGGNLVAAINDDAAFLRVIDAPGRELLPNLDYTISRFLAGGAIGLRAFAEQPGTALGIDLEGGATGMQVRTMRDFGAILVIADNPDDLRAYAEQVAPLADVPLLAAASYAAAPGAEPYTGAALTFAGLLVGGADAAVYQAALDQVNPVERGERVPMPTLEPLPGDPGAPDDAAAASGFTATVTAAQAVNVRGGAGTTFDVVTSAAPGTELLVLGFSDDGAWVNVQLDDGRDGWISASLLRLNMPETDETPAPEATPTVSSRDSDRKAWVLSRRQDDSPPTRTPRATPTPAIGDAPSTSGEAVGGDDVTEAADEPTNTPRPTRTPRATPTGESTEQAANAEAEATPFVIALPEITLPEITFDTDLTPAELEARRGSAFYWGIIASVAIISLGAAFNIVRGFRSRRRR